MREVFSYVILENTVARYFAVALILLLALFLKRFISRHFALILFTLFAKAHKPFLKDSFLELIIQPLQWFIFYLIAFIAFDQLQFPDALSVRVFNTDIQIILRSVANLILIISFIKLCIKANLFFALVLERRAKHTNSSTDNLLVVFFKDFFKAVFVIIGFLLTIKFVFYQPLSGLFTGLGIMGAAIALSTRESLENLIAAFIIFFDKPFTSGDIVKIQTFTGTVEKIGLRSTRIRTDQKTYITVPNKQMVDSILDNLSKRTQKKTEIRLELDLQTPPQKILELKTRIYSLIEDEKIIDSFTVWVTDTGKTAHLIAVDYFVSITVTVAEEQQLKESNILAILNLIDELEIKLQNQKPLYGPMH